MIPNHSPGREEGGAGTYAIIAKGTKRLEMSKKGLCKENSQASDLKITKICHHVSRTVVQEWYR